MNINFEEALRENKLAELDIARQSLEEKNRRIWELEKKVELLEGMLNQAASLRGAFPQPQPQPLPAIRTVPRRWSVK
ncbi:MAG TPA: hypothetical protein VMU17_02535 [Elusimicrobiota bacterium]|nr:hypothetical protein [Elusimicrobiota bacterium]